MESLEIRFTLNGPEEIEKFNIVKNFLKISKNTKVLRFFINEKFQEIQKLGKVALREEQYKIKEE